MITTIYVYEHDDEKDDSNDCEVDDDEDDYDDGNDYEDLAMTFRLNITATIGKTTML